jgi:hypothetical protein
MIVLDTHGPSRFALNPLQIRSVWIPCICPAHFTAILPTV